MRILGIGGLDHNGAIALVEDGRVASFLEVERVTRVKNAGLDDPSVLTRVLDRLGVDHVDAVGVADRTFWKERRGPFEMVLRARFDDAAVIAFGHHEAHAACAFACSPFEAAACVVIDGKGDGLSASAWLLDRCGMLERVLAVPSAHSLGRLWWGVSEFCGLPGHHAAGKAMALAAYGTPRPLFDDHIQLREDGGFQVVPGGEHPDTFRQIPRLVEWLRGQLPGVGLERHADAAASVQGLTERVVMHIVSAVVRRTGERRVCLAGGVALNGLANHVVATSGVVGELYVPPSTDDRGLALGAAALASAELGRPTAPQPGGVSPFQGPEAEPGPSPGWSRVEGRGSAQVVDWLVAGHPVSWFQGRDEAGPRALGHRSILASPRNASSRDRMNALKGREWFRPFGCAVKAERVREWFELEGVSPYMLRIARVREGRAAAIPGVLHVDATSRIQTVSPEDGSGLWPLLDALEAAGEPGVIMNTSLNGRGEPLAHTLKDAVEISERLGIERLVIDGVPHVRTG